MTGHLFKSKNNFFDILKGKLKLCQIKGFFFLEQYLSFTNVLSNTSYFSLKQTFCETKQPYPPSVDSPLRLSAVVCCPPREVPKPATRNSSSYEKSVHGNEGYGETSC